MSRVNNPKPRFEAAGFTLVEMLIVAPLALLVIAGFIALMVTMVGDAIANHNRNAMTFDIQSALNSVEQDVRLTGQFLASSGSLTSPQGRDDNTSAFTSTSGDLVLGEIATTKNPLDPTRGFVYYNAPFSCSDPAQVFKNPLYFNTVIYFVRNGSLWRRTYVPAPSGTPCNTPWQVNSCSPGYTNTTQCKASDSEVMKNVDSFSVSYYTNPEDTTAIAASSATTASTIKVTINGKQTAAGRTFTSSAATRVSKLSKNDIFNGTPSAPNVTLNVALSVGTKVAVSWPAVANAESYIVTYNINGAPSWVTATDNTTDLSYYVSAYPGDTVTIKVQARNTAGTSTGGTVTRTIPLWTSCTLLGTWANYGGGYETCGYTISRYGVVVLKGEVKSGASGASSDVFELPSEFVPQNKLSFSVVTNPNVSIEVTIDGRADTNPGRVRVLNSTATTNAYVGLDGIYFVPGSSLYNWSTISYLNSWTAYNNGFPALQTTTDAGGRTHLRGVNKPGTVTTGTVVGQLPAAARDNEYYHLPATSNSTYNSFGMDTSGNIVAQGVSSTYYSTQAMFYPSTYGSWTGLTAAGSTTTPGGGQLGNNWVAVGTLSGVTQTTPKFTKSADGIVTLKGLIKRSTGSPVDKEYIGRLPAGYCPAKTLGFTVIASGGAGRIDMGESGWIIYRGGGGTWLSLDGISFMADTSATCTA